MKINLNEIQKNENYDKSKKDTKIRIMIKWKSNEINIEIKVK